MLKNDLKFKIKGDDRVNLYEENKIKHKKIVENTDRIIAMHNEGMKNKEIAKIMGVSHPTIYYLLIKNGVITKCRKDKVACATRRRNEYGKKLKPFMERISPELRAMIERNTAINKGLIKTFNNVSKEEEDRELVGLTSEMEITDVVTKKGVEKDKTFRQVSVW